MHRISLNDIRIYAYHGCLPEEALIGGNYTVDIHITTDFSAAAMHDNLNETIDYVRVSKVVHAQMAIRSKLIEAVALRMIKALKVEFRNAQKVTVRVTKISAPMPGQVGSVSVEITE